MSLCTSSSFLIRFSNETEEELTREEERQALMGKMKVAFVEGQKIFDPQIAYKDPHRFQIFGLPLYLYNMSASVKFGVSFVLYFKSIDNLGTEIH